MHVYPLAKSSMVDLFRLPQVSSRRKQIHIASALSAIVSILSMCPCFGQILQNGSFESALTGWASSGNARVVGGFATDGTYAVQFNYAQLPPGGQLSQSFATIAGQS